MFESDTQKPSLVNTLALERTVTVDVRPNSICFTTSEENTITPNDTIKSVIIPIHNGEHWLNDCFEALQKQTALGKLQIEVSVFNDASQDHTQEKLEEWCVKLKASGIVLNTCNSRMEKPQGVGYAKNRAVEQSTGGFLCFQDVDDVMLPDRIYKQYEAAKLRPTAIVGSKFCREPADSTVRFTKWANSLDEHQLYNQVYTSHGPTLVMPTWFCSRQVFDRVGGFCEDGKGTPEDLIFFYKHLNLGGHLYRVPECLLIYRYHPTATTFSIHEDTIWDLRLERLQEKVLSAWPQFTIWNAGKQGRKFYRSLHPAFQMRVVAFCDVDVKKIGHNYSPPGNPMHHIPILHFSEAKSPFVICVKLDLTGGNFEENLKSLHLKEGTDYIHFS